MHARGRLQRGDSATNLHFLFCDGRNFQHPARSCKPRPSFRGLLSAALHGIDYSSPASPSPQAAARRNLWASQVQKKLTPNPKSPKSLGLAPGTGPGLSKVSACGLGFYSTSQYSSMPCVAGGPAFLSLVLVGRRKVGRPDVIRLDCGP